MLALALAPPLQSPQPLTQKRRGTQVHISVRHSLSPMGLRHEQHQLHCKFGMMTGMPGAVTSVSLLPTVYQYPSSCLCFIDTCCIGHVPKQTE